VAELAGQYRDGIGRIIPPQKISSEEFLSLMRTSKKNKRYVRRKQYQNRDCF